MCQLTKAPVANGARAGCSDKNEATALLCGIVRLCLCRMMRYSVIAMNNVLTITLAITIALYLHSLYKIRKLKQDNDRISKERARYQAERNGLRSQVKVLTRRITEMTGGDI